jgi:3-oxoacyl-[acyl-carrier protein] reductase
MRLKNKVALVTGSSKGIGEAIALTFAEQGASVVINGRNLDDLKRVEKKIRQTDAPVLVIPADVSNNREVQDMISEALAHFGKIDILVSNAGTMFIGTVEDVTEEDWDLALAVNLKSVFLCSKAIIPHMKKHKKGRIITMSSTAGKNPLTIAGTNYGVSKAGIIYLTRRMAVDLGKYGITVNCIVPGPIDTDMSRAFPPSTLQSFCKDIPLGRIGQPEDVSKVALFLASDDADYVTGEVIDVNGGSYID